MSLGLLEHGGGLLSSSAGTQKEFGCLGCPKNFEQFDGSTHFPGIVTTMHALRTRPFLQRGTLCPTKRNTERA